MKIEHTSNESEICNVENKHYNPLSSSLFVDKLSEDSLNSSILSNKVDLVDKLDSFQGDSQSYSDVAVPIAREPFDDFVKGAVTEQLLLHLASLFGPSLTYQDVISSVQQASDFFNMSNPNEIKESWTTGVMCGLGETEKDDILIFNRQQLNDMGITDKEGLDLVMTHEGGHRALQSIDTGFDRHQEELCCDFMAGVRAGLNNMDETKLVDALQDTVECDTHPDGVLRAISIESGINYAQDYYHINHRAPTFKECLDEFESQFVETDNYQSTSLAQVNLSQLTKGDNIKDHSNVTFTGYTEEARDNAKSVLIDMLSSNHIPTWGLASDTLWGGLDSLSATTVRNRINNARTSSQISDKVFNDLINQLNKASH